MLGGECTQALIVFSSQPPVTEATVRSRFTTNHVWGGWKRSDHPASAAQPWGVEHMALAPTRGKQEQTGVDTDTHTYTDLDS